MDVNLAENFIPGFGREVWESHGKIAVAYTAETAEDPVDEEGKQAGKEAREATGHAPQNSRHSDDQPVFDGFPHG